MRVRNLARNHVRLWALIFVDGCQPVLVEGVEAHGLSSLLIVAFTNNTSIAPWSKYLPVIRTHAKTNLFK